MTLSSLAAHARALVTALEAPTARDQAYALAYSHARAACEALYALAPEGSAWPKLPAPLLEAPPPGVKVVRVKRRARYGSRPKRPPPKRTTHAGPVELARWSADATATPEVKAYQAALGAFNARAHELHAVSRHHRRVKPTSEIIAARIALLRAYDAACEARLHAGPGAGPLPPSPYPTVKVPRD